MRRSVRAAGRGLRARGTIQAGAPGILPAAMLPDGVDRMTRDRGGFGLAEVLVAFAVLAVGFLPLFSMLTSSRDEVVDAADFVALLDHLDEQTARLAALGQLTAEPLSVEDGARALITRVREGDGLAAVAPLLAASPAPMSGAPR